MFCQNSILEGGRGGGQRWYGFSNGLGGQCSWELTRRGAVAPH